MAHLPKIDSLARVALDVSLDPTGVIDAEGRLVAMNPAMRSLLGIRGRKRPGKIILCDAIGLTVCEGRDPRRCRLVHVATHGKHLKLDEVPATIQGEMAQITLRAIPVGKPPWGAVVTVRNTTAETLVQAKYHRAVEFMHERDEKIAVLQRRLRRL